LIVIQKRLEREEGYVQAGHVSDNSTIT